MGSWDNDKQKLPENIKAVYSSKANRNEFDTILIESNDVSKDRKNVQSMQLTDKFPLYPVKIVKYPF